MSSLLMFIRTNCYLQLFVHPSVSHIICRGSCPWAPRSPRSFCPKFRGRNAWKSSLDTEAPMRSLSTWVCVKNPSSFKWFFQTLSFFSSYHTLIKEFTWARKGKRNSKGRESKEKERERKRKGRGKEKERERKKKVKGKGKENERKRNGKGNEKGKEKGK